MHILVVDDTRSIQAVLRQQLQLMGHTTCAASNGEQAVQAFTEAHPDLILMDACMPILDGFGAAEHIRAIETGSAWTPIIFLTAMADDGDLRKGIAAGGDDYLVKPVSAIVLEAKIAAMQRIVRMRGALLETTGKLDAAVRELQRLTSVDGLTGIANRRSLDQHLAAEWGRAMREQAPLSVVMLDVDHFKKYNDSLGHQAGDECLRSVAQALRGAVTRSTDLVARYGGEEFTALLPGTDHEGALQVAERLRSAVEELALAHPASSAAPVVTVSAGAATCVPVPDHDTAALLSAADKLLYESKQVGRNRVSGAQLGIAAVALPSAAECAMFRAPTKGRAKEVTLQ